MCTLVRMPSTPAVADPPGVRERITADGPYVAAGPEPAEANAATTDLVAAHDATTARRRPLRRQLPERLPGAVGADTVAGAGSVVTGDLPADVLAAGDRARVVRTLESP